MNEHDVTRRTVLKGGGAALAGLAVMRVAGPAAAFPGHADEDVIPWLDQPAPVVPPVDAVIRNQLRWEELDSYYTPVEQFFVINHYGDPPSLSEEAYRLDISGLVDRPQSLTVADLKARARHEVDFTMECSGNTGLPFFTGGVGNARWAGARLAPVLKAARVQEQGTEVVFWGADSGTVTIRDNSGILNPGTTGVGEPDPGGGLDLTITERFARSMSIDEALNRHNLLCYEMNGAPLTPDHGFPVRLIVPGWYGVASVKWLTHIELTDQRWAGRFMARDYVTIREETRPGANGDETVWTFATVSHDRLKSAPARVTRRGDHYYITGVAWGAPIAKVEVQIDGGDWIRARLIRRHGRTRGSGEFAWTFWRVDWGAPPSGEHTIRSRAIDVEGHVQPAPLADGVEPTPDDLYLASKVTYWESNGQISRTIAIP